MRRRITAAIAAILTFASLAHAEVRPLVIDNDDGGDVDTFIMWYERVRQSGVPVRVRGICASACTIVTSLPKEQVCIEPTASLGFHLFRVNGDSDPGATQAYIRRYYPVELQAWLKDQPDLTPNVVYMSAAEAVESGSVRPCDPSTTDDAAAEAVRPPVREGHARRVK